MERFWNSRLLDGNTIDANRYLDLFRFVIVPTFWLLDLLGELQPTYGVLDRFNALCLLNRCGTKKLEQIIEIWEDDSADRIKINYLLWLDMQRVHWPKHPVNEAILFCRFSNHYYYCLLGSHCYFVYSKTLGSTFWFECAKHVLSVARNYRLIVMLTPTEKLSPIVCIA